MGREKTHLTLQTSSDYKTSVIVFALIYDVARTVLLFAPTCSTDSIMLCVCVCLVLWVNVILPNRKQVGVHCACAGYSFGVAAVPVIPLSHQPHHQILQLCKLRLMDSEETKTRAHIEEMSVGRRTQNCSSIY